MKKLNCRQKRIYNRLVNKERCGEGWYICPHCENKVEWLSIVSEVHQNYNLKDQEWGDDSDYGKPDVYYCSECGHLLSKKFGDKVFETNS